MTENKLAKWEKDCSLCKKRLGTLCMVYKVDISGYDGKEKCECFEETQAQYLIGPLW